MVKSGAKKGNLNDEPEVSCNDCSSAIALLDCHGCGKPLCSGCAQVHSC